jgi:hypothetical protein
MFWGGMNVLARHPASLNQEKRRRKKLLQVPKTVQNDRDRMKKCGF